MNGWPENKMERGTGKIGNGINGHDGVHMERKVALKEVAGLTLTKHELIFKRDGFECLKCGSKISITIDHVKPKVAYGGNEYENLQTLCATCNVNKGCHFNDYRGNRQYPEDGKSPLKSEGL